MDIWLLFPSRACCWSEVANRWTRSGKRSTSPCVTTACWPTTRVYMWVWPLGTGAGPELSSHTVCIGRVGEAPNSISPLVSEVKAVLGLLFHHEINNTPLSLCQTTCLSLPLPDTHPWFSNSARSYNKRDRWSKISNESKKTRAGSKREKEKQAYTWESKTKSEQLYFGTQDSTLSSWEKQES